MKNRCSSNFLIMAALLTTMIVVFPLSNPINIFAQTNTTTTSDNMTSMTNMNGHDTMMKMKKEGYGDKHTMMGMEHKKQDKINGTINIMDTMYQAIESKFNVTLSQAITTAEQSAGNNSYAMSAKGEEKNGFMVYSILLGSPDMIFHKVTVDPGNGQVLQTEEMSKMEWMMMMHSDKGHQGMKMMKDMQHGGGGEGYSYGHGKDKGMKYDGGYDRSSEKYGS